MKSNFRYAMINHVIKRRENHLAKLKQEETEDLEETLKTWERFYQKMLNKYGIKDVDNYVNQ